MEITDLGAGIYTYDLAAGEALGKREGHNPNIEAPAKVKPDEAVRIKVSVGPDPNTVEHSIRWIAMFYYEEGRAFNPLTLAKVSFNAPTIKPAITMAVKLQKSGMIHALGYCNLHGLWSGKRDNCRINLSLSMAEQQRYRELSPRECYLLLTRENYPCTIIDVRTPREFSEGHLEGVENIDYYRPDFRSCIEGKDQSLRYLVYCQRGIRGHKTMEIMR